MYLVLPLSPKDKFQSTVSTSNTEAFNLAPTFVEEEKTHDSCSPFPLQLDNDATPFKRLHTSLLVNELSLHFAVTNLNTDISEIKDEDEDEAFESRHTDDKPCKYYYSMMSTARITVYYSVQVKCPLVKPSLATLNLACKEDSFEISSRSW